MIGGTYVEGNPDSGDARQSASAVEGQVCVTVDGLCAPRRFSPIITGICFSQEGCLKPADKLPAVNGDLLPGYTVKKVVWLEINCPSSSHVTYTDKFPSP